LIKSGASFLRKSKWQTGVPVDEYEYGYEYEEEEINIPGQPTGKRRSCHLIYRSTGGIFPVAVAVQ
jgi:hypothetical protein